jgi:hypothetical protein
MTDRSSQKEFGNSWYLYFSTLLLQVLIVPYLDFNTVLSLYCTRVRVLFTGMVLFVRYKNYLYEVQVQLLQVLVLPVRYPGTIGAMQVQHYQYITIFIHSLANLKYENFERLQGRRDCSPLKKYV